MQSAPTLIEARRAMRHLLDPNNPADARADYYAFEHPEFKTTLVTHHPGRARAVGYVCLSRTGLDLFRPLVTMRLPYGEMEVGTDLIYNAIPVGSSVLMSVSAENISLIRALFTIEAEQETAFFALDRRRYQPILNVLVTSEVSANNMPRYMIRRSGETVASASLNWQSPHFGEINVQTSPQHRRQGWGRSVVSAVTTYLVESGRDPIYVASTDNEASFELAQSVGFVDTLHREYFVEATLNPHP